MNRGVCEDSDLIDIEVITSRIENQILEKDKTGRPWHITSLTFQHLLFAVFAE